MSDGILSRWSRRKRAVQAAEEAAQREAEQAARAAALPPPEVETSLPAVSAQGNPAMLPGAADEADALAEAIARLPKLEDLTAQTDLAPFLRTGIPSALRNAALRKMWSVDPGIRDFVSEARDYAYDWNTPGGVPGLGPMLPTDDIKAMVERVMTGPPPLAPVATDPSQTEPADETGVAAEAELPAELPAAFPPDPDEAMAQAAPNPSSDQVEAFQSPAIVSRLRRHGGAMPV
ncbi:DUF3306 domain-containing protein [Methylobacterium sp. J-078]|uniref:DUF3306 domain-containing protein n=1 Tax=Methylobacterium sp. J-078 TaxID=2836657 RepID=UPI001FBA0120|nr:DUF3306 domain-containing protein [Methylobacterium sp. J-078]MCJ2045153.1 DUF3306 domain-containing protein [Methylobacterium sp. J-078]